MSTNTVKLPAGDVALLGAVELAAGDDAMAGAGGAATVGAPVTPAVLDAVVAGDVGAVGGGAAAGRAGSTALI